MADNTETFTFDSSQAQAELRKLDTVIDVVNGSIQEFNRTVSQTETLDPFSRLSQSVERYAQIAETRLRRVEQGLNRQNQSLTKQQNQWKTLGNIVKGFVVTRVLTEMTQLFNSASEAAADFQLTLARIEGIVGDINLDRLEEQLEGIAVALGEDLGTVAEAALEAFQNDLGTTEETIGLLSGAMSDLALVTGGTLTQAVNTLTPIIKAYGLEIDEASKLSAQLFNAIDNGVITLDQLEGQMGSIVPLAASLGVSVEEVFAAIATGTLAGVDTAKSITQLRNVMVKLVKPTDELKVAFRELGVASFQELQANSVNLRDAIDKIFEALGRDPERFARAFNTIRGQLGAINIQLENAGKSEFDRIMGESANSVEKLGNALDKIKDTDAFLASQQAQKFQIILTDLGETALSVQTKLSGLFLTLIPDANAAAGAIAGLSVAVTAYGAAWIGVLGATAAGFAGPIAAAAVAGAAIGVGLSNGIDKFSDAIEFAGVDFKELEAAAQKIQLFNTSEEKRLAELTKSMGNLENAFYGVDEASRKTFNEITARALIAGDSIEKVFTAAVERFDEGAEDLLKNVEKALKDVEKSFKDSEKAVEDIQSRIEDFNFEKSLRGLSEREQLIRQEVRAVNQLEKAQNLLSRRRNGDLSVTKEQVDAEFELATEYGATVEKAAEKLGLEREAKEAIDLQKEALLGLEEQAVDFRNEKARASKIPLVDQLAATKAFAELRDRAKELQELFKLEGGGQGIKQIEENLDEVKKKGEALLKDLRDAVGTDLFRDLGLAEQGSALVDGLESGLNSVVIDWTANREKLQAELAAADFSANVEFVGNVKDLAAQSGDAAFQQSINSAIGQSDQPVLQQGAVNQAIAKTILEQETLKGQVEGLTNTYDGFEKSVEANFQRLQNGSIRTFFQDLFLSPSEYSQSLKAVSDYQASFEQMFQSIETLSPQAATAVRTQIGAQLEKIKQDNADGLIPDARFKQLLDLGNSVFKLYSTRLELLGRQGQFNPKLLQDLNTFKANAEAVSKEGVDPQVNTEGVEALDKTIESAKNQAKATEDNVAAVAPAANSANGAARTLDSTIGSIASSAFSSKSAVDALAQSLRDAIALQQELNNSGGGGTVTAYRGGHVAYRAAGGASRGQDTVPAQLTPDEFVVNPQASRNFFSQLQSMNAGSTAASGPSGGNTTINVGDINVNSNSQLPSDTAREFGQSLKREIRRRNFRL